MNLARCADNKPTLYQDVPELLASAAVASCLNPSLTAFTSPIPRASWDSQAFEGRCAFVRTANDNAIPLPVQNMMLEGTGTTWITRDIDSGHSAQMAKPEELCEMVVELVQGFERM